MSTKDNVIALNSLQASDGWKLVAEWLDSQCKALQKEINTIDWDMNKPLLTGKDLQIMNMKCLEALKELPARQASYYEQAGKASEEILLDGFDFQSII